MWELLEKTTGNLSRILTKAVKTTGNETVSGSLVFGTQVSADYLDTKRNLNELDMGYIVENALYRSLHKQVSQKIMHIAIVNCLKSFQENFFIT